MLCPLCFSNICGITILLLNTLLYYSHKPNVVSGNVPPRSPIVLTFPNRSHVPQSFSRSPIVPTFPNRSQRSPIVPLWRVLAYTAYNKSSIKRTPIRDVLSNSLIINIYLNKRYLQPYEEISKFFLILIMIKPEIFFGFNLNLNRSRGSKTD